MRGRRDFEIAKQKLERVFTVLPPTNDILRKTIEIYRDLKFKGELIDERDLIVAATAISNDLPLLTRNRRHYERLLKYGLVLL